jgi:hypothetical protein
MPTIRGHKAKLKMFKDGQLVGVEDFTSFSFSQDSEFSRSKFIGNPIPEGDQAESGWSGSAEIEVRNNKMDDLIDALIADNLAGIGISDYNFTYTEEYPDGTAKSWLFFDIQIKLSGDVGGLDRKVTRKIDWQASGRVPLS